MSGVTPRVGSPVEIQAMSRFFQALSEFSCDFKIEGEQFSRALRTDLSYEDFQNIQPGKKLEMCAISGQ